MHALIQDGGTSSRFSRLEHKRGGGAVARRGAVLAAVLASMLLAGCSLTGTDYGATYRVARPDGLPLRSLQAEPVYLGGSPVQVSRGNVVQYGCSAGKPLVCQCAGRIGGCDCRCPGPRRLSR